MEESEFKGIWAVVGTPTGKYVGRLITNTEQNEVWGGTGWIKMSPAYEFNITIMPVQTPAGQMAMQRNVGATPVGLNSEDMSILVKPTELWLFEHMSERDQKKYKSLVIGASKMAEASLKQERMRESGIVEPGAQDLDALRNGRSPFRS